MIARFLTATALAGLTTAASLDRQVVVTGRVIDAAGTGVTGARVDVAGTRAGATAGTDGRYTVHARVPERGAMLEITARAAGHDRATRTVKATADTIRLDIVLRRASPQLEQMAVTSREEAARARTGTGAATSAAPMATGDVATSAPAPAPFAPYPHSRMTRRGDRPHRHPREPENTDNHAPIEENGFVAVRTAPRSTFSADVDRASYGQVRRHLTRGERPPVDAVRTEELINYFPTSDPAPRGRAPIAIHAEVGRAPWQPAHRLVRIALRAREVELREAPASNLVFLIDVSGSMQPANRLPLVKSSLRLLVEQLREQDRVAIVVYAGAAGLVLESTPGSEQRRIMEAIDRLEAGGSTAGGAGLRLAYDVARRSAIRGGTNRVILLTDGDFNVGESSDAAMMRLVEQRRGEGTFLTVLGYGMGNYKDSKLELLADRGNGNYAYVDDLLEARKVLVQEMGATLHTVAKDVKLQVEFDPRRVAGYRLIGYENRLLRDEDFNDDAKDAGDMGAGHSVVALYEVVPVGAESGAPVRGSDPLRYGENAADGGRRTANGARTSGDGELLFVKVRYKEPDGATSRLLETAVLDRSARTHSADFTFAAAVAQFAMLLRESPHRGEASWESTLALAREGRGEDPHGYRADFTALVERARGTMVANRD